MPTYLVLLQEDPKSWAKFTPEQMGEVLGRYMAWSSKRTKGKAIVDGRKLADEGGKVVKKGAKGLRIVDGPFAESKDVIGGYYVLRADSYDDCVALLQDHPHLDYGHTIAIRAIDQMDGK